ncbi:GH12 family glycosyl hydrolase domain-containing protein [Micromonospora auratinigra]|uniref:Ricin-type beta-trefoil lectin domain-containing protein n=1 Tax=Micromonospora auratinigra TaxID=261654 RepID=A0A1A8Z922_9ACTN|nr:RICIN domain-containing protein [Micromonospora auratinigra]SBT40329.1 Ricin-type beta-trefoil lectin domain-containing protein [Micromonospora auratinigra]
MRLRSILAAALLAVAAGLTAPTLHATPARADTLICDQYGSTTIQSRYVVQNNRWGSSATQCVNVSGTGFAVTRQDGWTSGGAPLSYPSIYLGCHYGNCSPGTNLPRQLAQIGSAPSSISYSYVANSAFDASYDIWLDPTAKTTGVNQMELMIWFNRQGGVQPVGSAVGWTTIGGLSWQVWQGWNGGNDVVSYVAASPLGSWSFDVMDFVRDVDARTQVTTSWYLTSVQAGFEPWQGGVGLAVNSFSAAVNAGGTGGTGGTGQQLVGQGSGRCVDVPANVGADGTAVQLWDCWSGATNQRWSRAGSTFVNPATGKCLDVAGGSTANGARVQLWTCNGSGAQNWQLNANGTVTNPQSGKCLDAIGQGTANGTGLQIYACYGGGGTQPNQVWSLR